MNALCISNTCQLIEGKTYVEQSEYISEGLTRRKNVPVDLITMHQAPYKSLARKVLHETLNSLYRATSKSNEHSSERCRVDNIPG